MRAENKLLQTRLSSISEILSIQEADITKVGHIHMYCNTAWITSDILSFLVLDSYRTYIVNKKVDMYYKHLHWHAE